MRSPLFVLGLVFLAACQGPTEPPLQASRAGSKNPPDFTFACTGLTCTFTDISKGATDFRVWHFGVEAIEGFENPDTFTYPAAGTYHVIMEEFYRYTPHVGDAQPSRLVGKDVTVTE
jgi:hypothetical protein